MRAPLLILATALTMATAAAADELSDLNDAFGALVTPLYHARAEYESCRATFPDRASMFQDSFNAWYHRHDMAEAMRAIAALSEAAPGIAVQLEKADQAISEAAMAELAADPARCDQLAGRLADNHDPGRALQQLKRSLRHFDIKVPPPPVSPHPLMAEAEILPLGLLSARLEAVMATIGSAGGAALSRDLREARAAEGEAWLGAHPVLMVSGRVIGDDEIREWKGDLQSRFALRCRSFDNETSEALFLQLDGQDAVVSGKLRSVTGSADGGMIVLEHCRAGAPSGMRAPRASGDDSIGLMPRPPAAEEVYAGPGAGIASGDIAHVLYEADFDFRLDGFGNSYTDRREAIWLLLLDGSAYRHDWSFPFADLNVAVSKARESALWFHWEAAGEGFTLTAADGSFRDLTDAQELVSPGSDFRPDARYYYRQIGMGGTRTDRSYAFSSDGTVIHRRSGFVAGNVGAGYLITSGSSDTPVTSTYRFEDFALILGTPGGEIRQFVARPASADADLPDTLLIGGEAWWLEEEE